MRCGDRIFKYEKSFYGKDTCYYRDRGTWIRLTDDKHYAANDGICKVEIANILMDLIDFIAGEHKYEGGGEFIKDVCNFLES